MLFKTLSLLSVLSPYDRNKICPPSPSRHKRSRLSADEIRIYRIFGQLHVGPIGAANRTYYSVNVCPKPATYTSLSIPFNDIPSVVLFPYIRDIYESITEHLSTESPKPVLIHCQHGVSRSPSIVIGVMLLAMHFRTLDMLFGVPRVASPQTLEEVYREEAAETAVSPEILALKDQITQLCHVIRDPSKTALDVVTYLIEYLQSKQGDLSNSAYRILPSPSFQFQLALMVTALREGVKSFTESTFDSVKGSYERVNSHFRKNHPFRISEEQAAAFYTLRFESFKDPLLRLFCPKF
jgi:hypothetical protein